MDGMGFPRQDGVMSSPCARMNCWRLLCVSILLVASWCRAADAPAVEEAKIDLPAAAFHIYSGNTLAHTSNTWSHGDHFIKAAKEADEPKETLTVSAEGVQS